MVLLRYYLRHLCNKERFAEWPIDEPVPLLQSVLGAWQLELRKAPQSMSRDDALKVLNVEGKDLTANAESDPILRRAYHKLAARYHPDKNPDPAAREVFEQVQKAYELLVSAPRASGGPDEYNISLMLQAQNILYTRCAEALKPFKYSGYPLLLQVRARREIVALSPSSSMRSARRDPPLGPPLLLPQVIATVDKNGEQTASIFSDQNAKLLVPAATLLHATIAAAPLNGSELARVGGVEAIVALFRRCLSMLTVTSAAGAVPFLVALPLLKTLSAIAPNAECTAKLASEVCSGETRPRCQHACAHHGATPLAPPPPQENLGALDDVVRCLHLTQLPKLLEAALDAVSALCANSVCQARLASAGAAWFGFALLTKYDFTLDEAVAAGVEASEESNAQLVYNARGRLAVTMLRRLGGYRNFGTSPHLGVRAAAQNILTSYLADLLDGATNSETMTSSMTSLLKLINSASETPYLIWNHHTRAELLEFVTKRIERSYASPGTAPLAEADNLVYESLKAELKVGAVYVRVYAQHPSFALTDATQFCVALLEYLTAHALFIEPPATQMGTTLAKPEARVSAHVALALNAMLTLLISTHNFNVEEQLLGAGRLRVLFSYAHERQTASALTLALQVAMATCNSAKCVEALGADVHSMAHLLALLRCAPPHSEHVLRLFTALSANQNVVGALLHHGGLIHVLHLFAAAQLEVIDLTDNNAAPHSGAPATAPAQDDADPPAEPAAPAKMVKINWSDEQRALAGGLLCKLAADRMHGPRINEKIKRLMPAVFVQTLADDAKRTVALFDASHENPELIWNASMRAELRSSLLHLSDEALASQRKDPTAPFELPADFVVEYVAAARA